MPIKQIYCLWVVFSSFYVAHYSFLCCCAGVVTNIPKAISAGEATLQLCKPDRLIFPVLYWHKIQSIPKSHNNQRKFPTSKLAICLNFVDCQSKMQKHEVVSDIISIVFLLLSIKLALRSLRTQVPAQTLHTHTGCDSQHNLPRIHF